MANAWQIRFEPTIVALTPKGGVTFTLKQIQPGPPTQPPAGSFPVVLSAVPKISERNNGTSPIAPGATADATVEFIGRPAPAAGSPAPPFVSIGVVNGRVSFDSSSGKPLPKFTAKTRKTGQFSSVTDYVPATTTVTTRSDWVMKVVGDPDSFDLSPDLSILLQMPWQFIENPGRMQLTVRLKVGTTVACDETINTPLDLPLKHQKVPDTLTATGTPLDFFGLRNLYAKANSNSLPRFPFGSGTLRVILHSTTVTFIGTTSTNVAAVTTAVTQIMNDAGFGTVTVISGAAADTECNLHWKIQGGHFIGKNITNTQTVKSGTEEVIPFFDFYIFAEDADPVGDELALSETMILSLLNPTNGTKALATPVVIAKGVGSTSPIKKLLAQIATTDHVNVIAGTICHEIGHTFGLRHSVAFIDKPPYVAPDSTTRGVMGPASFLIGSGTPRIPLPFFGPVHNAEIKRLFL